LIEGIGVATRQSLDGCGVVLQTIVFEHEAQATFVDRQGDLQGIGAFSLSADIVAAILRCLLEKSIVICALIQLPKVIERNVVARMPCSLDELCIATQVVQQAKPYAVMRHGTKLLFRAPDDAAPTWFLAGRLLQLLYAVEVDQQRINAGEPARGLTDIQMRKQRLASMAFHADE
jgi:hypothetical protein